MSGWIKLEKSLKDDPRVIRMASRMRNADVTLGPKAVTLVVGALAQLWMYADTHIRNDNTLDLGPDQLDDLVGVPGFCNLLPEDWLKKIDENTVELPDFQQHNGVEAKKRAVTQKRVERHRNAQVTQEVLPDQTKTKTSKSAKRSSRVPEDFKPDLEYAISQIPDLDAEAEAKRFRDWEFKTPRSDWPATWRTWIGHCKDSGKYSRRASERWQ